MFLRLGGKTSKFRLQNVAIYFFILEKYTNFTAILQKLKSYI